MAHTYKIRSRLCNQLSAVKGLFKSHPPAELHLASTMSHLVLFLAHQFQFDARSVGQDLHGRGQTRVRQEKRIRLVFERALMNEGV